LARCCVSDIALSPSSGKEGWEAEIVIPLASIPGLEDALVASRWAVVAVDSDTKSGTPVLHTALATSGTYDADAWSAWWSKHEGDPRFQPADEPARKAEYEGIVLETRTVAPIPGKGGLRRKPPHVLVLPQFGWSTAAFGPYLLPLRERAALSWVRLPTVQQLTGRSGFGDDIPTYPVDRLVRAQNRKVGESAEPSAHRRLRLVETAPTAVMPG